MKPDGAVRSSPRARAALHAGFLVAVVLALGVLSALACRSTSTVSVTPVDVSATEAMLEAQAWMRASEHGDGGVAREQAREAAERALLATPGWVAPERLLDDLAREELRGVEALQSHRAKLVQDPDDARELYLAGRLEGEDGAGRFEDAVRFEPALAWGHHGLAWVAATRGEARASVEHARAALARARDPWERSFFTSSLARSLVAFDRREEAIQLLEARIDAGDTSAIDQVRLAAEAVEIGLEARRVRTRIESYERGLELLRKSELSESEVESLVRRLEAVGSPDDPEGTDLDTALAVRSTPTRDRLRAGRMLDHGSSPLALGLLQRALHSEGRLVPGGPLMRAARFAAGEFGPAVERWLADLPPCVLTEDGLPRDPRLARVVRAVRALHEAPQASGAEAPLAHGALGAGPGVAVETANDARRAVNAGTLRAGGRAAKVPARADSPSGPDAEATGAQAGSGAASVHADVGAADVHVAVAASTTRGAALGELGEALVDAGWFREGRSVAERLASDDLDHALELETRSLAGLGLFEGIRRLLAKIDLENGIGAEDERRGGGARAGRGRESLGEPSGVRDLDGLLGRMGALFARANEFLGGETDPKRVARELVDSPRMSYGPVGELVHPGPWFSREDAREKLGTEREPVPGLASELGRLGRFGIFGAVTGGGGPDGAILARIGVEERSGRHLGVRWSGTVVWCEGTDLKSRAGRHGAHISAAALHEGYWLDIDAVRSESGVWNALRREFSGPGAARRVERVLEVRGLRVAFPLDDERGVRERTRIGSLLGEAQRVRLALLRDRAPVTGDALGTVGIDELVLVTATHEEGHLCDRTRFLPVSRNLPKLLFFLLDCGFSPQAITETLEYRAQLVCLAEVPDPRIALAQILDGAEQGSGDLTPHAAAYRDLLVDLLEVLARELVRDPAAYPELDRGYTLAHQLHRLSAEQVRRLARDLAHAKRLDR